MKHLRSDGEVGEASVFKKRLEVGAVISPGDENSAKRRRISVKR